MAPTKTLKTYSILTDAGESKLLMQSGVCSTVTLISVPTVPTHLIALTANGYTGTYEGYILPEEVPGLVEDVKKTKLATPLEMVGLTWLITGVTRAWTHQAVRYRIGTAFIQESMRFLGYKDVFEVFVPQNIARNSYILEHYMESCYYSIKTYLHLKDMNMADQDARGVLPTNIMTRLYWHMSLKTLKHIYETRWCCQAQTDEWIPVLAQMKKALIDYKLDQFLSAPIDREEPCGFNASFDRPCVWKYRDPIKEILE